MNAQQGFYENVTLIDIQLASVYYPILVDLAKHKHCLTYTELVDRAKHENPTIGSFRMPSLYPPGGAWM